MLKTILFVVACACASKPESLTVGANANSNGKLLVRSHRVGL